MRFNHSHFNSFIDQFPFTLEFNPRENYSSSSLVLLQPKLTAAQIIYTLSLVSELYVSTGITLIAVLVQHSTQCSSSLTAVAVLKYMYCTEHRIHKLYTLYICSAYLITASCSAFSSPLLSSPPTTKTVNTRIY